MCIRDRFISSCFCLYHLHRYEQICTYTYLAHICSYCICPDIHRYRQIWTCLRNMYHIRWKICTAVLAEWFGLSHGTGRSRDRFRVQTWEFFIFEERTGPPVLRTDLKPKIFFSKNLVFFLKMKFLDINIYAQICTDICRYEQIYANMNKYMHICTDKGLIQTDMHRYERIDRYKQAAVTAVTARLFVYCCWLLLTVAALTARS